MNMLDGLKVTFDSESYFDGDGKIEGVIVQSHIIEKKYGTDLMVAIMTKRGRIITKRVCEVKFHDKDIEAILNKPMEVISKVVQAERADSMERRTQILDIRS